MELEKQIHDKLLAVRRKIRHKTHLSSAPALASDLILNLAFAAEKGELTPEQYDHFNELPRTDLLCEFLEEARDSLTENRAKYGVDMNIANANSLFDKGSEKMRTKAGHVKKLTRAQLSMKYNVDNWHDEYKPYGVGINAVWYAEFLRQNNLFDMPGADITMEDSERDLMKLISDSRPISEIPLDERYGAVEQLPKEQEGLRTEILFMGEKATYFVPGGCAWINGRGIRLDKAYRIFDGTDTEMNVRQVTNHSETEAITQGLRSDILRKIAEKNK